MWGLGRTAALEYPGLWGGLIDLRPDDLQPDADPAQAVEALAAELTAPDGETQIIIAGGRRHGARLVHQPLDSLPPQAPPVRGDATYLVTGGLGMLGRSIAGWLIARGARHLVLAGRNAGAVQVDALFDPSETEGADIRLVPADIGSEDGVRRVMQAIADDMPPLKGVVHSAGVLDDGILAQLDWDRFDAVFAPRVYGGWLLHEATRSLELDFFVLNSSLLSLLGSAGQGNYTASSAFLDALAAHRRACGLPAMAINWCAWSEGGLATVSGARGEAMWASLGVEFMAPGEAMRIFDGVMHREAGQIAVAVADWPDLRGKDRQSAAAARAGGGRRCAGIGAGGGTRRRVGRAGDRRRARPALRRRAAVRRGRPGLR